MVRPGLLGRGLPLDASVLGASGFFLLVNTLAVVCGMGPILLVLVGLPLATGNAGGMPAGLFIFGLIVMVAWVPIILILFFVVGGIVHLALRLTGPTEGGYPRTLVSIGFGSGPLLIGGVPFLGYCLQTPAQIWTIVSMIMVLMQAQAVSGLRATFAVLASVILLISVYVLLVLSAIFTTAARPVAGGVPALGQPLGGGASILVSISDQEPEPHQVIMDDGNVFLGAVIMSDGLPGPQSIGGLPGITSMIPEEGAVTTEIRYRGRGFEAWSIPGIFMLKVGKGAGYARISSMLGKTAVFSLSAHSHELLQQSSWSSSAGEDAFYDQVVEGIDDMGGDGGDLDREDFERWLQQSKDFYLKVVEDDEDEEDDEDDVKNGFVDPNS